MRRFLYNHIYMPLVDRRDRNHGRNGFTFAGRIYQFLVSAYSKYVLKTGYKMNGTMLFDTVEQDCVNNQSK